MKQEPAISTDLQLVERVLAGDVEAFGLLVARYERLVRAIAFRRVREIHAAEDVVQDSFIVAFKSLGSLKNREQFGVWLQAIARRRAVATITSARRFLACHEMEERAERARAGGFSESSMELLDLIDQLPEHERLVIALKHFDGHSAADIASITGQSIGTITKQLTRARRRLHGWLTEEESEYDKASNR